MKHVSPIPSFLQLDKIYLYNYGGKETLYVNDIALVRLARDVEISVVAMPVCVDWSEEEQPFHEDEEGLVSYSLFRTLFQITSVKLVIGMVSWNHGSAVSFR